MRFEVVSNSWTSKTHSQKVGLSEGPQKQNSSYLVGNKSALELGFLGNQQKRALGGFNKQLSFFAGFLKQLRFLRVSDIRFFVFKEKTYESGKKTDIAGFKIHHLDEMYQKI